MRSIGCETWTRRPHALSLDCELPRDSRIMVIVGGLFSSRSLGRTPMSDRALVRNPSGAVRLSVTSWDPSLAWGPFDKEHKTGLCLH